MFKVLNGTVITLDMHTPSDGLGTILIKQLGKNKVWTKNGLDTIIRVSGKLGTSCILVMTIFIAFSPLFRPPYRIWDFDKVLLAVKLAHARIYSRFHARECAQVSLRVYNLTVIFRDSWGRRHSKIVAIDAHVFRCYTDQFQAGLLKRELDKVFLA